MMAKTLGTGGGNRSVGWIYLVSCGSLPLGLPKWGLGMGIHCWNDGDQKQTF